MDYRWTAFNIGINNGVEAGQSVMWPHVHMIPRRKGDNPNPRGGVRNVIPSKGDYDDVIFSCDEATRMPMSAPIVLEDKMERDIQKETMRTHG
jgi:diadenosine tetraphosphate (Ap4A) HIT family hydrolase